MILTEHDQHFPSHLTRTSVIVSALGIHGTRDYASDTLCQADDAADVEVSMPPYAHTLPDVRANTLDLMNGVWHWGAQNVGVHNPFPVTSSTSRAEECGGSLMVQHPQLPLRDACSHCTDDAVQMGESTWNTVIEGSFLIPEPSEDPMVVRMCKPSSVRMNRFPHFPIGHRPLLMDCSPGPFRGPHVPQSYQTLLMKPQRTWGRYPSYSIALRSSLEGGTIVKGWTEIVTLLARWHYCHIQMSRGIRNNCADRAHQLCLCCQPTT
ncbi:hypothetical protein F5J12DRAFT_208306 [Pisolithus orientalis]|uniref:uncharacterized protein n=1 Tax=Pisolithus orientalis TaxID=936130 RepID=UPI0022240991|nr:uncharacterized protein F5J12DRAFT_208306 [Pisolithus orientalis]KAI6002649.1 hypothetical protein F5J12DRAFT_208306 [Pisolithus orientalis]